MKNILLAAACAALCAVTQARATLPQEPSEEVVALLQTNNLPYLLSSQRISCNALEDKRMQLRRKVVHSVSSRTPAGLKFRQRAYDEPFEKFMQLLEDAGRPDMVPEVLTDIEVIRHIEKGGCDYQN